MYFNLNNIDEYINNFILKNYVLYLFIDNSGSMFGNRIKIINEIFNLLKKYPELKISLIYFNDTINKIIEPTSIKDVGFSEKCFSGTNIKEAITYSIDYFKKECKNNCFFISYFLTDCDENSETDIKFINETLENLKNTKKIYNDNFGFLHYQLIKIGNIKGQFDLLKEIFQTDYFELSDTIFEAEKFYDVIKMTLIQYNEIKESINNFTIFDEKMNKTENEIIELINLKEKIKNIEIEMDQIDDEIKRWEIESEKYIDNPNLLNDWIRVAQNKINIENNLENELDICYKQYDNYFEKNNLNLIEIEKIIKNLQKNIDNVYENFIIHKNKLGPNIQKLIKKLLDNINGNYELIIKQTKNNSNKICNELKQNIKNKLTNTIIRSDKILEILTEAREIQSSNRLKYKIKKQIGSLKNIISQSKELLSDLETI